MNERLVTVRRTVTCGATTITEAASAELADDVALDAITEAGRRALLAELLFRALPGVQATLQICPPLNQLN